jgi:hypothetical protein
MRSVAVIIRSPLKEFTQVCCVVGITVDDKPCHTTLMV